MALFNEFKKKVTDTANTAVKATKDLAESTRLSSQINDEQNKIRDIYRQIGELYYEKYGVQEETPFYKLCNEVSSIHNVIEQLKQELQSIKGVQACSNCGADVPVTSDFCGTCGTKVEKTIPVEIENITEETKCCVKCGTKLEDDAMFCVSCGEKQE